MKINLDGYNNKTLVIETFPSIGGDRVCLTIDNIGISVPKDQFFATIELLKLEKVKEC